MGTSTTGRDRLQRVAVLSPLLWCFTALILLGFICDARAQIVSTHATLAYPSSTAKPPVLDIKRANGDVAYQLSLQPDTVGEDVLVLNVVLRKPDADENLLEPSGNWHGYQEFMVAAWDLAKGPEQSIYPVRKFDLTKDKLKVRYTISKARVRPLAISNPQGQFAFDELVIEVEVDNAKS